LSDLQSHTFEFASIPTHKEEETEAEKERAKQKQRKREKPLKLLDGRQVEGIL